MVDATKPLGEAPADAGADADDNDRIISLSDGVFAFAMTLMVLQFDTPTPDRIASGALARAVLEQWSSFLAYAVTFLVIANYWIVHRRLFRFIRSNDAGLVWLNILFLFSVSFLPFPTDVMGEYGSSAFAVGFYAIAAAATSLISTVIWVYVIRRPALVSEVVTPDVAHYQLLRGIGVGGIFLLSVVIVPFSPVAARLFWVAIFFLHRVLAYIYRGRTGGTTWA